MPLGRPPTPTLFARVSAAAVFAPRVLPLPKFDDIGVCEHVAGAHVDTLAGAGLAQPAQKIGDTSEWNRLLARIEDLARLARAEKDAVVMTRLAVGVKLQNNSLQYSPELVSRLAAGMASDSPSKALLRSNPRAHRLARLARKKSCQENLI